MINGSPRKNSTERSPGRRPAVPFAPSSPRSISSALSLGLVSNVGLNPHYPSSPTHSSATSNDPGRPHSPAASLASPSRIPLLPSSTRAPLRRSSTAPQNGMDHEEVEVGEEQTLKREKDKWRKVAKYDDAVKARLVLERLELYETKTMFYVVASNPSDSRYRVLKIDRSPPAALSSEKDGDVGLHVTEDATIYSHEEISELLTTLAAGNGGIQRTEGSYHGIAGFVRFTSTYYMILIKARAPVALIGGHYVYHCEETVLKPISVTGGAKTTEESKMMASFLNVDMSKNFYFSYTYDITHTLQHNLTLVPAARDSPPRTAFSMFNDKFVWNQHLLRPAFREAKIGSPWVLPLVHGFIDQAKLSVYGKPVYITLIARRSRHFAGARFLKRGVNDQGYVANDVETEQIVSDALITSLHTPDSGDARSNGRKPNPRFTSFVQVRGSIPLYWAQEATNMSPKPPIELTIVDPFFSAAALHFDDLLGRYGGPITVLNLIKQKERTPRESKLLPEFQQCIDYLNQFLPADHRVKYIAWDIAAVNKQRDKDVIGILEDIAEASLASTRFFHSGPEPTWYALNGDDDTPAYRVTPMQQTGVTRTNCIDCLDRTNAAQFVIAKAALGHQLHALGIIHHPWLPFDSDAVNLITEMFNDHGNAVALQYGGSHLVNTMETYRNLGAWTGQEKIENLRRYWSNSFVDADKQAAMDLFLGVESSANVLPTPPPYTTPRRSYRNWYTPAHLLTRNIDPRVSEVMLNAAVKEEAYVDYWQAYYRPKLFTEMGRHFAFKMNATDKSIPSGIDLVDQSPFISRVSGRAANATATSASRRPTLPTRYSAPRPDASSLPDRPSRTPIEIIVSQLLTPAVAGEEAREYDSYVHQFAHLSLSLTDLTPKDTDLYRATVAIARGAGSGKVNLSVDKASMNIYSEAVRISR